MLHQFPEFHLHDFVAFAVVVYFIRIHVTFTICIYFEYIDNCTTARKVECCN